MRATRQRLAILATTTLLLLCLIPESAFGQLGHDLIHSEVEVSATSTQAFGKTLSTLFDSRPGSVGTSAYTGVIVQGYTRADVVTAAWRSVSPSGEPSDWIDLYVVRSATDGAFLAGYPGDSVRTDPIQVLVETSDLQPTSVVLAGVFDKRRDNAEVPSALAPKRQAPSIIPTVVAPTLITRSEWNAAPFVSGSPVPLSSGAYTNMTFHHAAGFSATTYAEGIAQVKAIQDFHQNGRGWSDIGYQFVIDRSGRVYQGRPFLDASTTLEEIPELARGAHVGELNTGNIGICLLGCYHPPEQSYPCNDQITTEALNAYVTMFAFLGQAYNIPVNNDTVKGHRDFSSTSCPGENNYVLLPTIREQAVQAQQFGNEIPDESVLSHNAPNPFSESTIIRYYLLEEGVVDLRVFDLNGREVAQLADGFKESDRWYTVEFDAAGLANGVYFSRIRVEGFSGEVFNQTKPLVHVD